MYRILLIAGKSYRTGQGWFETFRDKSLRRFRDASVKRRVQSRWYTPLLYIDMAKEVMGSIDLDPSSALQRVEQILAGLDQPVTVQQLRKLCGLRTATVCSCLAQLADNGMVSHDSRGYQLTRSMQSPAVSLSAPIDPQGNGNGKHSH